VTHTFKSEAGGISRRRALQSMLVAAGTAPLARLSLAAGAPGSDRRLVVIVLRGGMDGLGAVPAPGDPAFAEARGALAQFASPALPLDGPFALHPLLGELHALYTQGEACVVQATGLPYRERSHFDAQQVLESGGAQPYQITTGWLARALAAGAQRGLAISTAVPLVLRGAGDADTWSPSVLPEPTADLLQRLQMLYDGDPMLARALARAKSLRDDTAAAAATSMNMSMGAAAPAGPRNTVPALARQAAEFIARPGGPQAAVLEINGWDTHTNQVSPQGPFGHALRALDGAIAALRDTLRAPEAGGAWARTAVVVVTEFGREVAINGTQGSDHGTGGAAFVLGGAVRGGRVLADWPGLAKKDRFEGRDLRITTDLRAVLRSVLHDHLRVAASSLDREVFPGSGGLAPLDLIRG
jgi:uncharacterized protein (DUF1501 family)